VDEIELLGGELLSVDALPNLEGVVALVRDLSRLPGVAVDISIRITGMSPPDEVDQGQVP
jgi:hypothetical protein